MGHRAGGGGNLARTPKFQLTTLGHITTIAPPFLRVGPVVCRSCAKNGVFGGLRGLLGSLTTLEF